MSTAHKTDEEKKEYFDTPEELEEKVTQLANWIKKSKHFIAFTGAGISTSAGIQDFRSGVNTVLKTGPGAWEKLATGTSVQPQFRVETTQAIPTPTHMALCELQRAGYLKFLISQNTDGLHRRSGFPIDKLAELHGNSNLEICRAKGCGKQFMRDFRVRNAQKVHDHETGRKCESCSGMLYDSIINFGETLPQKALDDGFEHSQEADVCLTLGTSLRVTPAANMPLKTATKKNKGKLVIVNLQATPLDEHALKINAMIDDVMILLMKKLDLQIPPFRLVRRLALQRISLKTSLMQWISAKKCQDTLMLRGVDSNGDPYQLFPQLDYEILENSEKGTLNKEPFMITSDTANLNTGVMKLKLYFKGFYGEQPLETEINFADIGTIKPTTITMTYDPIEARKWINVSFS